MKIFDAEHLKSILDVDWTKIPHIFILISLFTLSRIFLLNLGFGADPDAWRIANSAFDLRQAQIYHTSRFPGYPLPEYVNSLFINHGWIATNSVTMILSLISVILFAKILKDLTEKNKGILILTYAFLPILWVNSTNTMDYMWAMTFIITVWFFILRKQYVIAGLMMGLAIGSRITSALLIPAYLYLILMQDRKVKDIVFFCISTIIVSSILFLPLFFRYSFNFLTYYPAKMNWVDKFILSAHHVNSAFGRVPTVFGFTVALLSIKILVKNIVGRDKDTLFLLLNIILLGILFVIIPHAKEYLIPMTPFGLLLFSKISKRGLFAMLCIILVTYSFVSFPIVGITKGKITGYRAIDSGMIQKNIALRTKRMRFAHKLMEANIENHSVVIIGWWLPFVSYLDENVSYTKDKKMMGDANSPQNGVWNFEKNIWYRFSLPLDELRELQSKDYNIYYVKGMHKLSYNYNLDDFNGICLDIEQN